MNSNNHSRVLMVCFAWVIMPFYVGASSYDPFNPDPTEWDVNQARREARLASEAADRLSSLSLSVKGRARQEVEDKRNSFEEESRRHSLNAQRLEERMLDNRRRKAAERLRQEEESARRRLGEEVQPEGVDFGENPFGQAGDGRELALARQQTRDVSYDGRFAPPCPQPGDARSFNAWMLKVKKYWREVGIRYSAVIDMGMIDYYNQHEGEKVADKLLGKSVNKDEKVADKLLGESVPDKIEAGCPSPEDYSSKWNFVHAYIDYRRKHSGNRYRAMMIERFHSEAIDLWTRHERRKKEEVESLKAEIRAMKEESEKLRKSGGKTASP